MTETRSRRRVAIVTYPSLPQLADDEQLVLPELEQRGVRATPAVWSDPTVDWGSFDAAVVRSTWDYHLQREAFLAWVDRVARVTKLWNRAPLLRWNTQKTYLRDLEARGVPIVPTEFSDGSRSLAEIRTARGWDRMVFKPSISADAHRTYLVDEANLLASEATYRALVAEQTVLVQPYLASVETAGEHSLVFLDGTFSHAADRVAALARNRGPGGGTPVPASEEERAFGRAVLSAAEAPTLYARIDVVRDDRGEFRLMELELVEPTLFLRAHPEAPQRLATAISSWLDRA